MRHVLAVAVFVAVLLCLPSVFAPEPPVPVRTPSKIEMLERQYPGLIKAYLFWYRETGSERAVMSSRAGIRLHLAYQRVLARAAKQGFRLQPPELRQTKPELVLLLGPGIRYIFAMHYAGPRIILVNGWWLERLEDWEVEYLVAHEVGHAIDLQNERRGHPKLDIFGDSDDGDLVADLLSILLTHPGSYSEFLKRHPNVRSIQER